MNRILMITRESFASNIRLKNEAFALVKKGWEVQVLSFGAKDVDYILNDIQVRELKEPAFVRKFSALSAELPFYRLWSMFKLYGELKAIEVEVVHIYNIYIFEAVYWLLRNRKKIKLVLDIAENLPEIMASYDHTRRGLGKYLINLRKWHVLQKRCIETADKIIVVTPAAREWYVQNYGMAEDKAIILPNVITPELIGDEGLEELKDRFEGKFVIFYFGDTSLRRGTMFAIKAMPKLMQKIPEVVLIIVGRNRREDHYLAEAVEELGISDKVILEGYQPMNKLGAYLQVSGVGISPLQRNPHHDTTLANKIFQYMYGSLPQVVSDCPAQAAIVNDLNCGLVYSEGDQYEFINCILTIYNHSEIAAEMGVNGRKAIQKLYNWDYIIKDYISYLAS